MERYRFYKDLVARLRGKSRPEVEALLGKPDYEGMNSIGYVVKGAGRREYSFNSVYYARIEFDDAGVVKACYAGAD